MASSASILTLQLIKPYCIFKMEWNICKLPNVLLHKIFMSWEGRECNCFLHQNLIHVLLIYCSTFIVLDRNKNFWALNWPNCLAILKLELIELKFLIKKKSNLNRNIFRFKPTLIFNALSMWKSLFSCKISLLFADESESFSSKLTEVFALFSAKLVTFCSIFFLWKQHSSQVLSLLSFFHRSKIKY